MEKIALITGASGYIGTRLVRKLLASGYRVVAFDLRFSPAFVEEFDGKVSQLSQAPLALKIEGVRRR